MVEGTGERSPVPSTPPPSGAAARAAEPDDGEAFPESFEEGRETEVGPSETEPLREDFRDPADLDLDRGGRMAGGGKGGGSCGKIMFLSPPGTLDLRVCGPRGSSEPGSSTGENVTDFLLEPLEVRLRSVSTRSNG